MDYSQALAIGTSEGTVKNTYATIYADEKGMRPLFSIQRKNFEEKAEIKDLYLNNGYNYSWNKSNGNLIAVYTGYGKEALIAWDRGGDAPGLTGYATVDFPIVYAEQYTEGKLVPVKLLYETISYLKMTLAYATPGYYVYEKDGKYTYYPKLTEKQYSDFVKDEYTIKRDLSPAYRELRDNVLNQNSVYYVKPDAFVWNAVNCNHVKNASGEYETAELKKAKADLEKAKRILILAGGAALL